MDKNTEQFIKDLLKEAGFGDLSKENEDAMIQDIAQRLEDRILLIAVKNLKESDVSKFEKVISTGNDQEISDFLNNNIENFNEKLGEALADFREEYLKAFESTKKAVEDLKSE